MIDQGTVLHRSAHGYVLVLTIGMLAILTVAAGFIFQRVSSAQKLAGDEQLAYEKNKAISDARARVLWTIATFPRVRGGGVAAASGIINLDGRWYRMANGVYVSLQDTRGLINLNTAKREYLERLLTTYKLDAGSISAAVDSLLDYCDSDVLVRLNGAEKREYQAAGLPPPRDQPLLSPMELARVYHWRDYKGLWGDDGILNHVYVDSEGYINPHTATWRTLAAVFSLGESEAKRLVDLRTSSGLNLYQALVGEEDPFVSIFSEYPAKSIVVTFAVPGEKWVWRMLVKATPQESQGPWRTAYSYRRGVLSLNIPDAAPSFPTAMASHSSSSDSSALPF